MDLIFIIVLLVLGMGLIVLELIAVPGTTICGIGGIALTIWGLVKVYGEYGMMWGGILTAFDLIVCIILLIISLKTRTWKRFAQIHEIDSKVNTVENTIKVGDCGMAVTRLAPMGTAEIGGQRIEVYTAVNFVDPGTNIIVEQVDGSKIRVKPVKE